MKKTRNEVFISPDGGETVYVQNKDGSRGRLVSKTQYAKDMETRKKWWTQKLLKCVENILHWVKHGSTIRRCGI